MNINIWNKSAYVTIAHPSFLSSGEYAPPKNQGAAAFCSVVSHSLSILYHTKYINNIFYCMKISCHYLCLQTAFRIFKTQENGSPKNQDFRRFSTSCWRESDPWPPHYQCDALPTEPQQHKWLLLQSPCLIIAKGIGFVNTNYHWLAHISLSHNSSKIPL